MTEHRQLGEVRAAKPEGVFTALAVRYGVVDSYGSWWSPGWATESLNARLPFISWSHDWASVCGRATTWRDTPEGPEITARLDVHPDVPLGRQALAQLLSKTITDVSVGFSNAERRDPTDAERKQYPGIKEVILRANLDELALVALGAVPGAKVLAVRSRPTAGLVVDRQRTDDLLAQLGAGKIDLAGMQRELERIAVPAARAASCVDEDDLREALAILERRGLGGVAGPDVDHEADEALRLVEKRR